MSEKSKALLERLGNIARPTVNTVSVTMEKTQVFSNCPTGKWIDRIYKMAAGSEEVELINKDSSLYRGKIHRRRITDINELDGANFFSVAYETADGRWFDRTGFPIAKPKTLAKETDNDESEPGSTTEIVG
jgi:hypothetical protein